jgi:signal transduction histidine kinase
MDERPPALEQTLLWIVTGYRIFAAIWLAVLGGVILGNDSNPADRPGVVVTTMVLAAFWAGVATLLTLPRPRILAGWWFIAIDLAISCWTIVAGDYAGTIQFAGGYPLVGAFSAIYGFGWTGGAVGAIALTATGLSRILDGNPLEPQDFANSIAHLFSVAAASGVAAALRTADRRRSEAEAALERERNERIRAEEHAELAAHLHDSVLQTLALIQRDPTATADVRGLARHQERELRAWLFPERAGSDDAAGGFREALVGVCSEIEDLGPARVEVVVVGDHAGDSDPIVRAAREAVLNATKHSGAETVSVYGEANETELLVFVKDRGSGFDPASIAQSRQGIRESIVSRMERHGGTAELISAPGKGTEVRLRLPLEGT